MFSKIHRFEVSRLICLGKGIPQITAHKSGYGINIPVASENPHWVYQVLISVTVDSHGWF